MLIRGLLSSTFKIILRKNNQIDRIHTIQIRQLTGFSFNKKIFLDNKLCYSTQLSSSINALLTPCNLNFVTLRKWKHNKSRKSERTQYDSDEDEPEEDPDIQTIVNYNKNAKILNSTVSSMRIDAIVKASMGLSRNKAEIALYDGKLRINGKIPVKKGVQVGIDDVIDFLQGPCPKNENFLLVTRVTILDANLNEDAYKVKMLREKSLTIEKYEDSQYSTSDNS
ncbi:hypothetical protein PV327_000542 [Microctonus hyperodae]|uniref:Mitochondrial transcription rescue factor 1 C-terminal domain-containing protein n=1 Tax=Microctonus hyperodae TaxID=165561 RepID=A0AA39G6R1_MICHY|nr:hypothetical protein PV327_000542 [Microctonus hyperodae]